MTLEEQAQAIYNELFNKYKNRTYIFLDFDEKNPNCPKKLAAQKFVQSINDRLKSQPQLLTTIVTEMDAYSGSHIKKAPLFIVFQKWIESTFSYGDKSYGKQLYDWIISGEALFPDIEPKSRTFSIRHEHSKNILGLLKTYDIVHQEFVDIAKLISALEHLWFGKDVLQEYSQEILNRHFENFKNSETSDSYYKSQPSYSEEQRRRACSFINEMRIMSIVTEKTEMFHSFPGDRDYDPPIEDKRPAISYLSTQTKRAGYELLKIPVEVLISTRLATLLKAKASLVDIERIQNYIKVYTLKDPSKAVEFSLSIQDILLQSLKEPWSSESKTNLVLFTMQQAIVSQNLEYILAALQHLNELLNITNNSDEWYKIFAAGCAASQAAEQHKEVIADKVLEPVAERFGPAHIAQLRQRLVARRAESPGRLLFSMQFNTPAPSDVASSESASSKRMRHDVS